MAKHSTFDTQHRRLNASGRVRAFSVRFGFGIALMLTSSISAQDTVRQYLSGHGKDDAVPWKFQCTSGANSGAWTNLPVPSQWDMHGFGTLSYKKDATNAWDERGLYEREFAVPGDLKDKRIFLIFDGAMTDTGAKVNGESVGPTHQGGFYRFKYEITKQVRFGETNRLEVTVAKHSTNNSVNDAERLADYWVFGGIYRPVYFEAVPQQFVERVAIDAKADGSFAMDVFVNGNAGADKIEAQIMTLEGKPVGTPMAAGILTGAPPDTLTGASSGTRTDHGKNVHAASISTATLRTKIASPQTWTAETPNLYSVEVRLKQGTNTLHRYSQHFGFRTMEVRDGDGLYVNGERVILKGVNRHSFWPDSGRCLSDAIHRLDIETIKDMNMNAVRMSHYPPDAEFLDLCDELGLYVLDELAGWHSAYDTEVGSKLVEEMIARDVNHPSILFWDNGNEGGWNTNLDQFFTKFDPQQRRVLHPWSPFNGVNTAHYLGYENARVAAEGKPMFYHHGEESEDTNDPNHYIYMPTEFMHGLYDGGAGAGLEDYWKMMSAGKGLGGGFIWTLVDEGVKRPDTGEIDLAGNQAPDGIVGPDREREGSFYAIKELWSPIQITREANGSFTVENHYSFINTEDCEFTWQRLRFDSPDEPNASSSVVDEDTAAVPPIPPGGKGSFRLRLPKAEERVDAIALRVDDPAGRELWTWTWPLSKAGNLRALLNASVPEKVSAIETSDAIEVKSGGLVVTFAKRTGLLSEVSRGSNKFSLSGGPRLAVGSTALTDLRFNQDGRDYLVSATFSGDLKSVLWRVKANGWVQCDFKYTATGIQDFFGVVFDYPADQVQSKRWLGDGPSRVWKNRQRGVTFNVWENDYNDTVTGYRGWEYPEFKGCFANVRWLQLETTEGTITVVPKNIPFVQVLTPGQPPDNLEAKTKVNLPLAGLGFLQGIPAIGTKFKDANLSGPSSQPNTPSGEYSGSVSFYFGDLPQN